jgi:hypothetical protein
MTKPSKQQNGLLRQWFGQRRTSRGQQPTRQTSILTPPTLRRDFVIPLQALTPAAHLDRLTAVVRQSFARVETVNSTQALARQQLDVADYTLHNIIEELRAVMPGQFPRMVLGTARLVPIQLQPANCAAGARFAA